MEIHDVVLNVVAPAIFRVFGCKDVINPDLNACLNGVVRENKGGLQAASLKAYLFHDLAMLQ